MGKNRGLKKRIRALEERVRDITPRSRERKRKNLPTTIEFAAGSVNRETQAADRARAKKARKGLVTNG